MTLIALVALAWGKPPAPAPAQPTPPAAPTAPAAPTPPAAPTAPAAPSSTPGGPTLAPCTILQPTFTIDAKNQTFGTMFAVKVGEAPMLVTAHSLFSAANGLAAQVAPDQLGTRITALTARDAAVMSGPAPECARSGKAMKVADAAPMAKGDGTKDVAVFAVAVAAGLDRLSAVAPVPLAPLAFAAQPPKVGEQVWLGARVNGKSGILWPATVVEVGPNSTYFEYADRTLDLAGTIGAPILDAKGAVVGMNLGSGKMEDGALIGSASPLAALKQRVEGAKP